MKPRNAIIIANAFSVLIALCATAQGQDIDPKIKAIKARLGLDIELKPQTKEALREAGDLVSRGDLEAAEKRLEVALRGLAVSGKRGEDYFVLRRVQLRLWSKQSQLDRAAAAYADWMRTTASEDVADDFVGWTSVKGGGGYERFRQLLKEYDTPKNAEDRVLARLLVGEVGYRVGRQDFADMEQPIRRAADQIRRSKADLSKWSLLQLAGFVHAPTEDPEREVKFIRLVFESMGQDQVDFRFLEKKASVEFMAGDVQRAREALTLARPMIGENEKERLANWLLTSAWVHRKAGEHHRGLDDLRALETLAKSTKLRTEIDYVEQAETLKSMLHLDLRQKEYDASLIEDAGSAQRAAPIIEGNKERAVSRSTLPEDNWRAYVEKFIQVYKLDEKQQNAALSGIHKETLSQAKNYREKRQGDFASIESQVAALAKDPKGAERREALQRQKAKLEEPMRTMFVHMDGRLKALPREDQRAGADAAQVQALQMMYDDLSGKRLKDSPDSRTTRHPSTQPATGGVGVSPAQPSADRPATQPVAATQPADQPAAEKPAAPTAPHDQPTSSPAATPPPKEPAAPTGEKPKIPDPPKPEESGKKG